MADWKWHENVEVMGVYKKLDMSNSYLLKLRIPQKDSIFSDYHEVEIQDSKFAEQLNELKEGKRERCYFAFGIQNIDVYKTNDTFAITHSPHEGLNIGLILAKNQFDELLKAVNFK